MKQSSYSKSNFEYCPMTLNKSCEYFYASLSPASNGETGKIISKEMFSDLKFSGVVSLYYCRIKKKIYFTFYFPHFLFIYFLGELSSKSSFVCLFFP